MNNNSLGNTKTNNTIEVYVYDASPDGRPILKSKSEYDVSVTKYITSSYESIQSDSENYLQCDEDTAEKSSSTEISTNRPDTKDRARSGKVEQLKLENS
ncbi:hypothetical protein [Rickettsia sp. TH2014]|uniref:hypothetical protein n=1 Tax=Rickettsia sp. TH2014 TaxID=1967503 RepID=UPI001C459E0A|nr:hypothetical protein [Rickettsia sp. TH2014]